VILEGKRRVGRERRGEKSCNEKKNTDILYSIVQKLFMQENPMYLISVLVITEHLNLFLVLQITHVVLMFGLLVA
jgi:hypothetical protein